VVCGRGHMYMFFELGVTCAGHPLVQLYVFDLGDDRCALLRWTPRAGTTSTVRPTYGDGYRYGLSYI
jgi:hypothetical protein